MSINAVLEKLRWEVGRGEGPRVGYLWRSLLLADREGESAGRLALEYVVLALGQSSAGKQVLTEACSKRMFGLRNKAHPPFFDGCFWRSKAAIKEIGEAGFQIVKMNERGLFLRRSRLEVIYLPLEVARIYDNQRERDAQAVMSERPNAVLGVTLCARLDTALGGTLFAELEAMKAIAARTAGAIP